jgi:lysophospholipase
MADGANTSSEVRGSDFVLVENNPPPVGAEAVWIEGRNRRRVRLLFAPDPPGGAKSRGTVIVGPGRTEFIEKYFEVARDLQARGFAVVIIDWPGQGLSDRLMKDPSLGHVSNFGVYVDALVRGMEALKKRAPKPWVMLAHSMGGAIALEAMRTRRLEVSAAAFSAPMWGFPIWFFQRWYARSVRMLGAGGMPARPPGPEETFENNQLTHDEPRWRLYRRLVEAEPRLAVGEPTVGWVVSSLNVFRDIFEPGALDHIRELPMLVGVAEEETIVKKSAQRALARRFKAVKVLEIEGSGHEILMETDARRAEWLEAFDAMLKKARI